MPHYHFISGLPRSGSTLLAGILRQHSDFHAAMSSPVAGLMNGLLEQTGASSEFFSFFSPEKRMNIITAMFNAYYQEELDKTVIFDTSRIWTARMHQLKGLFEDFKVVCCVRNPAWIADSFELIYRKNPFEYSRMFTPTSRQTVYSRCESLMASNGTIGQPLMALKEAYYGEYSDKLLLVDYDLLTQYPQKCLSLIYQFLGLPEYNHDFDNVVYEESEFDERIGASGLHKVSRKVEFHPRRSILPPDLFDKYKELAFWEDNKGTQASIIGKPNS
ncbi:sulfotransferase [Planctobacterium marinum]|uniref:Sulfotransferase n=1 Tax=Planctobacterium marinum TaxID=1631968 RepID=A0AA48KRS7_9ALTE|nr:hypothetical protein MACH26_34140 [Planctobacterium marinum]